MRDVTLIQISNHHIEKKYLNRTGIAHVIACAYHTFKLTKKYNDSVDLATNAV
ncbi:hypothetical protein BACCIP111895_01919 [Neobacillus rhizosphaerae]|uniref:Transposase n=1 Tax=Neobacillus rhizosphaerae TaxID=2880965 RepID=A0ABM9ERI9_9BACI|nr:hypothetical protein [Neobacillus rhizosphaerae]CAH2714743.1 hypothetical protein BACCIP111895_01919 [Neobacillus rhizosphaerae]